MSTKVFIGFGLGIILGIIFKEQISVIKLLGDLFLRLIKMIVVPLVLFSIISGLANMSDIRKLKRVGSKTLLYYLTTMAVAGFIGLMVARFLKPGTGFVLESIEKGAVGAKEAPKLVETLLNMVQTNSVQSLIEGNLMQIIVLQSSLE